MASMDPVRPAVRQLLVDEAGEGQRIDNFLVRTLKGVPKSHVYRILRSGEVRVNGGRADPSQRLAVGDKVRVPPIRTAQPATAPARSAVPRRGPRFEVLHEDDDLIAIDKPSGLAVHGGSGISMGLIEGLRSARPEAKFLELVHRLDRETSGVLLVAKRRATLVALHALLRDGGIDKRYQVLVRGRWRDEKRTVRLRLHKFASQEGERRVRVDDDMGRESSTTFHRLKVWSRREPPVSLLEAELHTGRTHQIRVHLTHLGFPLAGDDKYGDFAWNRELAKAGLKRMFLHAGALSFVHPGTGTTLSLVSPLPGELARFTAGLDTAEPTHA